MDQKTAVLVFVSVVGLCVSASAGVAIRAARSAKRHSTKISIVQTLLACALSALLIALAHVILGGQLSDLERRGLWNDGTLIAFPTSLAALGASLTSLWAVLWTGEASERRAKADLAGSRRRDAVEVLHLLEQFDRVAEDVRKVWLSGKPAHAHALDRIRSVWWEILDELLNERLEPSDPMRLCECTIHPPDVNLFLRGTEYGSSDSLGCEHFRSALETRLTTLYTEATQVAAFRFLAMRPVTGTMQELRSLLHRLRIREKELLADGILYSEMYPEPPPDPETVEGRFRLATILSWIADAAEDREEWEKSLEATAAAAGIRARRTFIQSRLEDDLHDVRDAYDRRARLRRVMLQKLGDTPETLSSGSDDVFWDEVMREANVA